MNLNEAPEQQEQVQTEAANASTAAPQATPAEAAKVAAVTEAKESGDSEFHAKFAQLTRKEKEIFRREQMLKQKEQQFSKYESLEKLRETDPYGLAKELNLDLNRLIEGAAKDGQPETVDDKVKKLEEKIAAYEKRMAEDAEKAKQAENQKQIDAFRKSMNDKLKAEPDRYELIHLQDAFDTVFDVIEEHFNKTQAELGQGEVLDIFEAADRVEKFLEQNALKYAQAKKLGFQKSEPKPSEATENKDATQSQNSNDKPLTLSAAITPSTGAPPPVNESPEEARARIAAEWNARIKAARRG